MVQTLKKEWLCYFGMAAICYQQLLIRVGLRRAIRRSENLWGKLAILGLLKRKVFLLFLPKTWGEEGAIASPELPFRRPWSRTGRPLTSWPTSRPTHSLVYVASGPSSKFCAKPKKKESFFSLIQGAKEEERQNTIGQKGSFLKSIENLHYIS